MSSSDTKIAASVIIMTKNEELVIDRTVKGVLIFDQVCVVDSCSQDRTTEVAKSAGAEVVEFEWDGKYPKKKQWALENAALRHDWVLFVDADEVPSAELVASIRSAVGDSGNRIVAYDADVEYWFSGRKLVHGHRIRKRALIRRSQCYFPEVDDLAVASMWEVEGHYQPVANGRVGRLAGLLVHNDIDPLYDFFSRHNRYSDWEAYVRFNPKLKDQLSQVRGQGGRLFSKLPAKPVVFFVYAYFMRRGFLDGSAGLQYALAYSFYLWQIWLKKRELERRTVE